MKGEQMADWGKGSEKMLVKSSGRVERCGAF